MPPPPQLWGDVQEPQSSSPPQPSGMVPQFLPWSWQELGLQPQTLGTPPPPQLCGAAHAPQLSTPPQPLGMMPQFLLWAWQLVRMHASVPASGVGASGLAASGVAAPASTVRSTDVSTGAPASTATPASGSSSKSTEIVARPLRRMISVTSAGGSFTSVAYTGLDSQAGTAPAPSASHAGVKASPEKVA